MAGVHETAKMTRVRRRRRTGRGAAEAGEAGMEVWVGLGWDVVLPAVSCGRLCGLSALFAASSRAKGGVYVSTLGSDSLTRPSSEGSRASAAAESRCRAAGARLDKALSFLGMLYEL